MVRHWESLVAEQSWGDISDENVDMAQPVGRKNRERDDGQRRADEVHASLTVKSSFSYADTGLVDSTDPGWIQSESDTLTGLFDRVGLRTNIRKTVGMECNPLWETGVQVDKAYTWRMMGEVRIFKERQRERVLCLECDKEFAKGSLVAHHQNQHGVAKGGSGHLGDKEGWGDKPRTFRMAFPAKA